MTNDKISFSIVNQVYSHDDVLGMPITDANVHRKLEAVRTFQVEEDNELLRAIDEYRRLSLEGCEIQNMKESMFSLENLPLATASPLKKKDREVVQKRLDFLVKFSAAVATLLKSTHFEDFDRDSSI